MAILHGRKFSDPKPWSLSGIGALVNGVQASGWTRTPAWKPVEVGRLKNPVFTRVFLTSQVVQDFGITYFKTKITTISIFHWGVFVSISSVFWYHIIITDRRLFPDAVCYQTDYTYFTKHQLIITLSPFWLQDEGFFPQADRNLYGYFGLFIGGLNPNTFIVSLPQSQKDLSKKGFLAKIFQAKKTHVPTSLMLEIEDFPSWFIRFGGCSTWFQMERSWMA